MFKILFSSSTLAKNNCFSFGRACGYTAIWTVL